MTDDETRQTVLPLKKFPWVIEQRIECDKCGELILGWRAYYQHLLDEHE